MMISSHFTVNVEIETNFKIKQKMPSKIPFGYFIAPSFQGYLRAIFSQNFFFLFV